MILNSTPGYNISPPNIYSQVQAMINTSIAKLKSVFAPKTVLYIQTSSITVANTAAETSLLTATTSLPANFFTPGKQILVRLRGFHSSVANPNIRIRIKLNSTTILDTGNNSSGNSTNAYFDIDGVIECRTTGVGGTVIGQGFYLETGSGSNHFGMVNTSTIVVNTTIAQTVDITVQWGTASMSDTITATNGYITFMEV